ncbi:MAG: methyltransferase domain-containing protein [Magnetococcales bacterium]|nr:methyltransferase domain-containing protein [Magnetococcales bacterium]
MGWLGRLVSAVVGLHSAAARQRWMMAFGEALPPDALADALRRLLAERSAQLPPDAALRLILALDNTLYSLAGRHAIRLEGGTHAKHRLTAYHDFFVARLRPGETVLDGGCGLGELALDMAERGEALVTGVELDEGKVQRAREQRSHPRLTLLPGDLRGDPPPGGPWETVVLSNVLEHLTERPALLRHLQKTMRPRRFLLRVPLFQRDWRVPLKQELGLEWRLDPTHETEYTPESFASELRQAGLRLTHREFRWGEIWAEAIPDPAFREGGA